MTKKFSDTFHGEFSPYELEVAIDDFFVDQPLTIETYNLIVEKWAEGVKKDLIDRLQSRVYGHELSNNKIIKEVSFRGHYGYDYYGNIEGVVIDIKITGNSNE